MSSVRAKKNLGQHFLTDQNIARKIVESLQASSVKKVVEIGPGMGVLTKYLLQNNDYTTVPIEIDRESVAYLKQHYPQLGDNLMEGDFLKLKLTDFIDEPFAVIGNFPYNISSQIYFKILEHRDLIPESVGMIQKEVAERICSGPGNKIYGILSVLIQAFYKTEYLFTVHENVFNPPPRVKSAVIRLVRNEVKELPCDEKLFIRVVKGGFNQRRKMLRSSLKSVTPHVAKLPADLMSKRPEQLSVAEFIELTRMIEDADK